MTNAILAIEIGLIIWLLFQVFDIRRELEKLNPERRMEMEKERAEASC
jgi:hypothetical protein